MELGRERDTYSVRTDPVRIEAGTPTEIAITGLRPDTRYFYRMRSRSPGAADVETGPACSFHTQRAPGSTFVFALQGDSHPERLGKMYHPDLYERTMRNVASDHPDFYVTLGDDFSIERLIERNELSQPAVDRVYAHQRSFLGLVGCSSPLFLVNGNHEQAARYLLDGTPNSAAVLAGRARTRFFPLPAPGDFYQGDAEEAESVGLLRDYYSWTWGDALFVVLDPYWHSPVPVDNKAGPGKREGKQRGRKGQRDLWDVTIGDAQYRWLTDVLTRSRARFKFVFAHHVLGTGRGGIEMAGLYEWGGKDRRGVDLFAQKRPGWELPIHDLMVNNGVTIFFQGHDHLFARQELDGITYQSVANPADDTYTAFNADAYRSGDVLPNSGHLRVTVSPQEVRVDYVRAFLPDDETEGRKNGAVAFRYAIEAAPEH
ncbi:MAG: metallophosphoesterase family protein [Lentisphaerae bacterium]|nr:metallophosphoesterase family protein [Lentisphaerota bacterium]